MSPPTYKNIVIAGAGYLGTPIVNEFAKNSNFNVFVLTRESSTTEKNFPSSVTTIPVDYDSLESVVSGLERSKANVVINLLNPFVADKQQNMIKASVKTGVQLYLPSEFGFPTDWIQDETNPLNLKKQIVKQAQDAGLKTLVVFNGLFPERFFLPHFGFDLPKGKAHIVGDGRRSISFTTREDIARFLVYAFANVSQSELENKTLRLEGSRSTIQDALSYYSETHENAQLTDYKSESLADAQEYVKTHKDVTGVLRYLTTVPELGYGTTDSSAEDGAGLSNHVYKDWNPTPIQDVLKDLP